MSTTTTYLHFFVSQGSQLRLRLSDYSSQTIQALLSFLQSGAKACIRGLSPAAMKELALVAKELEVPDLLQLLDGVLAGKKLWQLESAMELLVRCVVKCKGHLGTFHRAEQLK